MARRDQGYLRLPRGRGELEQLVGCGVTLVLEFRGPRIPKRHGEALDAGRVFGNVP